MHFCPKHFFSKGVIGTDRKHEDGYVKVKFRLVDRGGEKYRAIVYFREGETLLEGIKRIFSEDRRAELQVENSEGLGEYLKTIRMFGTEFNFLQFYTALEGEKKVGLPTKRINGEEYFLGLDEGIVTRRLKIVDARDDSRFGNADLPGYVGGSGGGLCPTSQQKCLELKEKIWRSVSEQDLQAYSAAEAMRPANMGEWQFLDSFFFAARNCGMPSVAPMPEPDAPRLMQMAAEQPAVANSAATYAMTHMVQHSDCASEDCEESQPKRRKRTGNSMPPWKMAWQMPDYETLETGEIQVSTVRGTGNPAAKAVREHRIHNNSRAFKAKNDAQRSAGKDPGEGKRVLRSPDLKAKEPQACAKKPRTPFPAPDAHLRTGLKGKAKGAERDANAVGRRFDGEMGRLADAGKRRHGKRPTGVRGETAPRTLSGAMKRSEKSGRIKTWKSYEAQSRSAKARKRNAEVQDAGRDANRMKANDIFKRKTGSKGFSVRIRPLGLTFEPLAYGYPKIRNRKTEAGKLRVRRSGQAELRARENKRLPKLGKRFAHVEHILTERNKNRFERAHMAENEAGRWNEAGRAAKQERAKGALMQAGEKTAPKRVKGTWRAARTGETNVPRPNFRGVSPFAVKIRNAKRNALSKRERVDAVIGISTLFSRRPRLPRQSRAA